MLNQQAENPSVYTYTAGIIRNTRSGRSQASKTPGQQPRLTRSLSSDGAERADRNLILNERAPGQMFWLC